MMARPGGPDAAGHGPRQQACSAASSASGSSTRRKHGDRRRRRATASPHQVPSPHSRHRHKRERREDEEERPPGDGRRVRRERSRSRSRRRERKRQGAERDARKPDQLTKDDAASVLQPPQDWRGPVALDPRGAPPHDWRGPSDYPREWRGPHGPHGGPPGPYPQSHGASDLRWFAERPPPRPISFPPPVPGPYPQRPMPPPNGQMRPGPEYGWHAGMPPRPDEAGRYRGEPPVEWRGPGGMQQSPYGPRGAGEMPGDLWTTHPPSGAPGHPLGPPSSSRWGGAPPGDATYPGHYQQPPPGFARDGQSGEPEKPFDAGAAAPPAAEATGAPPSSAAAATAAGIQAVLPALTDAAARAAGRGADVGMSREEGENGEDALPPPPSVSERLRSVRIVRSALSERMLARLRSAGVPVDSLSSRRLLVHGGLEEATASEEAPVAAAAAQARCTRLGLEDGRAERARPLPPVPGPPRLPACTLGLAYSGLWERFQAMCGAPLPAETPPIPCELRTSRGGGHVVVPLVIPSTAASS